ncbi:MAG: Large extracellular alpha-helical protein, partial [Myxococcaceae bacterium]|nr:Large extracellular alpha-helical protein [Myxococcaceae bacterium]
MRTRSRVFRRSGPFLAGLALALFSSPAKEQVADPAARGLAFFVHAPSSVIAGTKMPIDIEALGFATVTSPAPLAGAAIEVAWDTESLDNTSVAPPSVTATSDAKGRSHIDLPVPPGDGRKMKLLVGLKHGGHERTESLEIARLEEHKVELHVSESDVVPGGAITAWTRVARTADGLPIQAQPVEVELLEGSFARWSERVTTDASGMAVLRVPIPRTEEAGWTWTLRATAVRGSGRRTTSTTLTPRDETPGTPTIRAEWERASAIAGDVVPFVVHVRDASQHPLAGLAVRTWVGPQGTAAPTNEDEWKKVTTLATTDASGTVHGTGKTPTLIPRGATKQLQLVVRAIVEARAIEEKASIEVGAPAATVEVLPEAPSLVPGIDERALVRILDGRGDGIAGDFVVEGDGLKETVKTNAAGEAELTWHVPEGIGAKRDVGPCAGGVAAAVRIRSVDGKKGPFDTCVSVDREASGLVRTPRPFARGGERIHLDIVSPKKARVAGNSWSVLVTSPSGAVTASGWIDAAGGDITLGAGDPGTWQITVASPQDNAKAHVLGHELVVGPAVLPSLEAKLSGGRLVPGGRAEVDADLVDDHGKPLQGSVSAVLIDAEGGGNLDSLGRLDTRSLLCGAAGIDAASCSKFIAGDKALDATARASLNVQTSAIAPLLDPAGTAKDELRQSFSDVLHSLEGAILQSTTTPDALGDVRRKSVRGWEWNPELMTLVTASMEAPPLTPGGEPIALGDLLAVDPQVTFDVAARRVTRLKLFRVLVAVRTFRKEHALDPGEPAWKNPNALLRRLVRDGGMEDADLLDPWGGTIQFVPASGGGTPFLDVAHGFSLHAPGPDGALGSGDDVKDPFERVVRSKSPYAEAMSEDRLVDAKFEMEVSDSTIEGWQTLMDSLTGVALGNIRTLGHGTGTGTGQGFGAGHGRLGGSSTTRGPTLALATGAAYWSPPIRTDARGHV